MIAAFLEKRHKKKITNEFKNYLVLIIVSVGEVSDRKSSNKYENILEQYIFEYLDDLSPRKQVVVDEILKRVVDSNTQKEKLAVFIFEYFFVYSEGWSDYDRQGMRDDFMERVYRALDFNKIA